jgi:hypothetical protein
MKQTSKEAFEAIKPRLQPLHEQIIIAMQGMKDLTKEQISVILKLEKEVRGWSLVVNNLKKQDAPLNVLKCASNEVSRRIKKINRIKSGFA